MPTPSKTDADRVVAVGGELLDAGGPDAVTMAAVAGRVGVRAPSLYKHVRDRRDLLARVLAATVDDLNTRAESAREADDPRRTIRSQLAALREFATERPHGYALIFGAGPGLPRATPDDLEPSLTPLLAATTALVGEEHALDAARFLVAWANGFITMQQSESFRMGGDIDAAWEWGLERAVAAVGG